MEESGFSKEYILNENYYFFNIFKEPLVNNIIGLILCPDIVANVFIVSLEKSQCNFTPQDFFHGLPNKKSRSFVQWTSHKLTPPLFYLQKFVNDRFGLFLYFEKVSRLKIHMVISKYKYKKLFFENFFMGEEYKIDWGLSSIPSKKEIDISYEMIKKKYIEALAIFREHVKTSLINSSEVAKKLGNPVIKLKLPKRRLRDLGLTVSDILGGKRTTGLVPIDPKIKFYSELGIDNPYVIIEEEAAKLGLRIKVNRRGRNKCDIDIFIKNISDIENKKRKCDNEPQVFFEISDDDGHSLRQSLDTFQSSFQQSLSSSPKAKKTKM